MVHRWLSAQQVASLLGSTALAAPLYRDLAGRIRLLVVDGRLSQGVRLPSERDLAEALRLSRSTVAAAYAELRERGFLQARPGSGNFVAWPEGQLPQAPISARAEQAGVISFAYASAAAPPQLAAAYAAAGERLSRLLAGNGYYPDGIVELRVALAQWFTGRGLPTTPEQLIITAGALSALNVVASTLLAPGDRTLVESPSYPNAITVLGRTARLVPYPLPPTGWQPRDVELALRQAAPRMSYLIPDFHNPSGAWMTEEARPEVAAALHRYRSIAVVDETLVQTGLEGEPMRTPLAAYLPDAITIGSASKAFWGGLRIGWIRAPRDRVRALIEARAGMDLGAAPFEQLVLTELLTGDAEALATQRHRLRVQRDRLTAELATALPDWRPNVPAGGLSLWVTLPSESSSRMAALAEQHDLVLTAGPRFFVDGGGERHLRLPYTASGNTLAEAVRRLAALWNEVQRPGADRVPTTLGLTA